MLLGCCFSCSTDTHSKVQKATQLTVFTQTHRQLGGRLSDGMCHSVGVIPVLLLLLLVAERREIVNLQMLHQKGTRHFFLVCLFSPAEKLDATAS